MYHSGSTVMDLDRKSIVVCTKKQNSCTKVFI